MNESNKPEEIKKGRFWKRKLPLETETSLFILANAMDAMMTWFLLNFPQFRESNGIANYILSNYGMQGMIYFKFIIVAFVAVIAQIIARKNIKVARRLLIFGSIFFFAVAIYSGYLFLAYGAAAP